MTFLLDHNPSPRLRPVLEEQFAGILHVAEIGLSQSPDQEIWRQARDSNWVIISKDADFADMALLFGAPPKVIRLRIGNGPWRAAAEVLLEHLDSVRDFLDDSESSLLVLSKTATWFRYLTFAKKIDTDAARRGFARAGWVRFAYVIFSFQGPQQVQTGWLEGAKWPVLGSFLGSFDESNEHL